MLCSVLAPLAIGAALVGAGCGSSDDAPNETEPRNVDSVEAGLPPNIVRDRTIDEQKSGTPERTLYEWWQAFQFRDVELVIFLTDRRVVTAVGRERISNVVRRIGPGLQGIRILGHRTVRDTASMRVAFLSFTPKRGETTAPSEPTASTPSTLLLRERRGRWLFADSSYLQELARNAGL